MRLRRCSFISAKTLRELIPPWPKKCSPTYRQNKMSRAICSSALCSDRSSFPTLFCQHKVDIANYRPRLLVRLRIGNHDGQNVVTRMCFLQAKLSDFHHLV